MRLSHIYRFLKYNSGRIVAVGDTFDHYRSSVVGETEEAYLSRTRCYWKHIKHFVIGNHDAFLLRSTKNDVLKNSYCDYFLKDGVLALHGHQLKFSFDQAQIMKYEKKWFVKKAPIDRYWDIEEWFCKIFNRYFNLKGKRAYAQALNNLQELDNRGLLDESVHTVITGHTHLPFRKRVVYKNKRYRVINTGSSLHGKRFNPVYIKDLDLWFVSDLHLGSKKSKLD